MSRIEREPKYELEHFWVYVALRRKSTGKIEPVAQSIVYRAVSEEHRILDDDGKPCTKGEIVGFVIYGVVGQLGEGKTRTVDERHVYDTEEECQAAIDDGTAKMPSD